MEKEKLVPPDWKHWIRFDRWKLAQAICLLVEVEPNSYVGGMIDARNADAMSTREQKRAFDEAQKILEYAGSSYESGSLELHGGENGPYTVTPAAWVAWARRKNLAVPKPLRRVYPDSARRHVRKRAVVVAPEEPLGTKERNSLLVMIAAMAKHVGINVTRTSQAAAKIAELTQLIGTPMTPRAIENHLKNIPEALERRGK